MHQSCTKVRRVVAYLLCAGVAAWLLASSACGSVRHSVAVSSEAPGTLTTGWPFHDCGFESRAANTVWGVVTDMRQEALQGAQVYVASPRCGILTDSLGRFGLRNVAPSDSLVSALLLGFARGSARIPAVGNIVRVDFTLELLGVYESLAPEGDASTRALVAAREAVTILGCYSIELHEPYGPPIADYGGPWAVKPADFPGLPGAVQIEGRTVNTDSVALSIVTRNSDEAASAISRWQIALRGDTIWASWTGSPFLWWIRHRLHATTDSLIGASQYVSHQLQSATQPRRTIWRKESCGADL
jgi:hypothetical protein